MTSLMCWHAVGYTYGSVKKVDSSLIKENSSIFSAFFSVGTAQTNKYLLLCVVLIVT